MLTIRQLNRSGLAPFDLDLADGECVALSGPSGAGKTILLRTIADLDPNKGSASLDCVDREAIAAPQWRRSVAFLPAEAGWWACPHRWRSPWGLDGHSSAAAPLMAAPW